MTDERARGWYPDPDNAGWVRYWDGEHWTDSRRDPAVIEAMSGVGPFTAALWSLGLAVGAFVVGRIMGFDPEGLSEGMLEGLSFLRVFSLSLALASAVCALVGFRRIARQVAALHGATIVRARAAGASDADLPADT